MHNVPCCKTSHLMIVHFVAAQFGVVAECATLLCNKLRNKRLVCRQPYAYFTPQTRTRQNYLVLSCPCQQCDLNWRQDKTVLSCLVTVSNLQLGD